MKVGRREKTMERQTVHVSSSASISFGSLCWLTWLVFLILKLTNVLPETFTWFWVWFPFWLPFALTGVVLVIAVIFAAIFSGMIDR